jgi:ELWxxDGT repeat protein
MKWSWRALFLAVIAAWIGACDGPKSGTDGHTSWLSHCAQSSDCDTGLECLCGVCTRACSTTADCEGIGPLATCTAVAVLHDACDGTPPSGGGLCLRGDGEAGANVGPDAAVSDAAVSTPDASLDAGSLPHDGGDAAPPANHGDGATLATRDAAADAPSPTHTPDAGTDSGVSTNVDGGAPCHDDDGDGVCNAVDVCPGSDDRVDTDGDGRPDGCEPSLLLDINTATNGSRPGFFTELSGSVYFVANDGFSSGGEIWKTDVAGGPATQIDPGAPQPVPSDLTTLGDRLLFFRGDGTLWSTDGGVGAASLVASDFNFALPQPVSAKLISGGLLYFRVFTGVGTDEVWRTDGTPSGTVRLNSGPGNGDPSFGPSLVAAGGFVFFAAPDPGGQGLDVWRTDGTPAGTFPVTAPGSGIAVADPRSQLATLNGRVYFVGLQDPGVRGLWSTDGTAAGTRPALASPPADFAPWSLTATATHLFVTTYDYTNPTWALWVMAGEGDTPTRLDIQGEVTPVGDDAYVNDGHAIWRLTGGGGPVRVYDIPGSSRISSLVPAGTGAYFALYPGSSGGLERIDASGVSELLSVAGVLDLTGAVYSPQGRLYFGAMTSWYGRSGDPWVSDGTPAGTHELARINKTTLDSDVGPFLPGAVSGAGVVFSARTPSSGLEPWITFGDAASTRMIEDAAPGYYDGFVSHWAALDGYHFFVAQDQAQTASVHRVDAAGNVVALTPMPFEGVQGRRAYPGSSGVLFAGTSEFNWVSRTALTGSAPSLASAQRVQSTSFGAFAGSPVHSAVEWSGAMWFSSGSQLWFTDGTVAGTELVDQNWWTPLVVMDNHLYASGAGGWSRWDSSAGTPTAVPGLVGTLLTDVPLGGYLYFGTQTALYRSDGTAFEHVADLAVDTSTTAAVAGNRMFLFDRSDTIWVTDGTSAGTHPVMDRTCPIHEVVAYRGLAYFCGADDAHGYELWRSDGTSSGTFMEGDLAPGIFNSNPSGYGAAGDALYFKATTREYGTEPWVLRH